MRCGLKSRKSLRIFGKEGGFILSPVDNVRELNPVSQRNIDTLIREWQRLTGGKE